MKKLHVVAMTVLTLGSAPAAFAQTNCTGANCNPLTPISTAANAQGEKFGALADTLLCERFKELKEELALFTDVHDGQTAPILPHDSKHHRLRKNVAATRFLLDVFVPAYPKQAGTNAYRGEDDLYEEIREHLDVGYEQLGEFKDLWDTQRNDLVPGTRTRARQVSVRSADFDPALPTPTYDLAEVARMRAGIYQWMYTLYGRNFAVKGMFGRTESRLRVAEKQALAQWEAGLEWDADDLPQPVGQEPDTRYRGYVDYVCNPMKVGPYDTNRRPRELPKYFWRILAADDVYPEPQEEGIPALSRMSIALLKHAANDRAEMLGLTDLTEPDQEEAFHDFRKLIRGVVNIFEAEALVGVEEQVKTQTGDKIDAEILDDIVGRFGDLEDMLVGFGRGRVTKAEIDAAWLGTPGVTPPDGLKQHLEDEVFANTLNATVLGQ